jgi:hypothetical protein
MCLEGEGGVKEGREPYRNGLTLVMDMWRVGSNTRLVPVRQQK